LFKLWTVYVLEPPLGGLRSTYTIRLMLVGKRMVDFLFVLIELFFVSCYGWSHERI